MKPYIQKYMGACSKDGLVESGLNSRRGQPVPRGPTHIIFNARAE